MTFPRRVLPGLTFLITRRTLRRTHLLRPDAELNNLVRYCLAYTAQRHGVAVHCATLMSSHEHLVVTDTRGTLPNFLHDLHRMLALGIKVLRKWEGAVWDHEKTSVVELRTEQAVLEKIAYCIANPVAAGLVRCAAQWPGVTTAPAQLGRAVWSAERPTFYLDQDNPLWPATLSLTLHMPKLEMTDARAREIVDAEVKRLEFEARKSVKANGWRVLGAARVSSLSPFDRATSREPLRSRNPTFAVGRMQRAAFAHAVSVLRAFREAYRAALNAWRNGMREVCFPAGTWLMRDWHRATVALT
jgi:REP element-mobilizing transposase RayT